MNTKLEDIYMYPPEGHIDYKKCIWKLNKALYGLKQSGRAWNKLNNKLLKIKFKRLISDPCIYVKKDTNNKIICLIGVYVDDILLAGTDFEINKTKSLLTKYFELSDLGEIKYIIGIQFEKLKDGYLIHQEKYTNYILNKFKFNELKPISNMMPTQDIKLKEKLFNTKKYQQVIGSLLYLATCTRPDILFAVVKASRNASKPSLYDWENVKRIIKYLKGNSNYGIKYTKNKNLNIYVDADYAGDNDTRRSTTGYVINFDSGPISWYSKLLQCIALSTAESEYYAIVECAKECLWLKNVFNELGIKNKEMVINSDNQAAIFNCENNTTNPKSKYINIRYHKIRELIENNIIKIRYIKTTNNLADGFTKFLNGKLMNNFRNNLLTKF